MAPGLFLSPWQGVLAVAFLDDGYLAADLLRSDDFLELRKEQDTLLSSYRSQDWPAARKTLAAASAHSLSSGLARLYDLYQERIDQLETNPPGADWDGVTIALVK